MQRKSEKIMKIVGGIESNKWLDNGKNLCRNYKQGYSVYDSDGIACALTAQGIRGLGGYSGLYLIIGNEQS